MTQSFNENYQILKQIAEQLKNQAEPNIDELIPQVEKAMHAYRTCKERLDSVTKTLNELLPTEVKE